MSKKVQAQHLPTAYCHSIEYGSEGHSPSRSVFKRRTDVCPWPRSGALIFENVTTKELFHFQKTEMVYPAKVPE